MNTAPPVSAAASTPPERWSGWARNGSRGRWRCLVHGLPSEDG
jgi:hypothetical protein